MQERCSAFRFCCIHDSNKAANNPCLIDRTHLIQLNLFYHALVIMIFDRATSFFVPWVFYLFSKKGKRLYLRLFHEIIFILDWVWEPEAIVCDFEHRLLKAVQQEFNNSQIYGCYFHWKQ
ncbi:hypothetical protein MXB_1606, partial [Myxobolus squamalis]